MINYKHEILDKIGYTELVYGRINKKLLLDLSPTQIEGLILKIISETDSANFIKTGKNIYITNSNRNIRLTVNSFTCRIITADQLDKRPTKN